MNFDFNNHSSDNTALNAMHAYSAHKEEQRIVQNLSRQSAKRDATLVAGAEASIAQKELLEEQLEIIREQNKLLLDNYEKLKELYDDQVQANKEAKEDLEKSRRFNRWMMVISVIAMLAAVAGPVIPLFM